MAATKWHLKSDGKPLVLKPIPILVMPMAFAFLVSRRDWNVPCYGRAAALPAEAAVSVVATEELVRQGKWVLGCGDGGAAGIHRQHDRGRDA